MILFPQCIILEGRPVRGTEVMLTCGPALTIGFPGVPAPQRRTQGLVPETDGLEDLSHPAGAGWCAYGHACYREEGISREELQDCCWQQCFPDPMQWWDIRRRKPAPSHPDFEHKTSKVLPSLDSWHMPPWVDSQLWDAGMKKPSESISTELVGRRDFGRKAGLQDHAEVGMCRKLCENSRIADGVNALDLLVQRGCHVPNNVFYLVVKRCKDLVLGRRIHALTVCCGYEGDAFLSTHLIGMYASHGRLEEAMRVFTKVSAPDAYNWATIIFAYGRHGEAAQAIRLYRQMHESSAVKATDRIYVAVLKACAAGRDLAAGKDVHSHILLSPEKQDRFVQAALVDMYAKCGCLEAARDVFDGIPDRNVVIWTAMIAGYAQQGMGQEALSLYNVMQQEGLSLPDSVTYLCLLQACASVGVGALVQGKRLHSEIQERGLQDVILGSSLVNMYAKCNSLEDARRMFDELKDRNVLTWNAMLSAYAQHGMGQEAITLYSGMQEAGITPDSVTFVCLLQACAIVAALPLGKQLHAQIEERGLQANPVVGAALVNMYAKCGSMFDSQQVFDSLPEKNIEAWGALMSGYSRQGDSKAVFYLVSRMRLEGIQPDGITFLSVLTVCSHVGLVDEGRKYFEAMSTDKGISPTLDHYICMIDLLGRAGHLDEALQMAKTMPFPPDSSVWHTLLGACWKWNNVEIGQQAFEFAVGADGKDAASYVLMSNIYGRAQMWGKAKELQGQRKRLGAWKKPGQSWWTDMDGVLHTFVVGDKVSMQGFSS